MPESDSTVFLIDDDEAIRNGLSMLLRSHGYRTETFGSDRAFLFRCSDALPERCMAILDLSMPEMNGLDLQMELLRQHVDVPVVFLSGEGDIPAAVDAVRRGAVDSIEKPVDSDLLFDRIEKAMEQQSQGRADAASARVIRSCLESLTPRELEVLENIAAGKLSKAIAVDLGISEHTVELHRSRVLKKLGVRNSSALLNRVIPHLRAGK